MIRIGISLSSVALSGGGAAPIEAIENGNFSAGQAPWVLIVGDEASDFSGGNAAITSPQNFGGIRQTTDGSVFPIGTVVDYSISVSSVSGGSIEMVGKSNPDGGGSTIAMTGLMSSAGLYSGTTTLAAPMNSLAIRVRTAGASFTVDDVSVIIK